MKRMKVLIGKRRVMVIATLAILVLAAAALAASSASFSASSANLSNTFTTGQIDMSGGTFTVSGDKLMPGHSTDGTINVTATADGGTASLYMKRTALAGTGSAALFNRLTLAITESHSTDGGATWSAPASVYTATALNDLTMAAGNGVDLVTVPDLATGCQYRFALSVDFPDGGVGADNGFENMTAIPTYVLTAISD
jgi:hypothetical protein